MKQGSIVGMRLFLLLVAAWLVFTGAAKAQQAAPSQEEVFQFGDASGYLNGPWKFTVGDSPIDPKTGKQLWAEPGFDDSHWENVTLDGEKDPGGWGAHGHPEYIGYAWYRLHVKVHAPAGQSLAIAGPWNFDDAYQVFVNGAGVGGFGFERGKPALYYAKPAMFPIPGSSFAGSSDQVIAFRFWLSKTTIQITPGISGGFRAAPSLGTLSAAKDHYKVEWLGAVSAGAGSILSVVLYTPLVLLSLLLFLFNRHDRAFLWMFVLCLLSWAGYVENQIAAYTFLLPAAWDEILVSLLLPPAIRGLWYLIVRSWFGLPRRPLLSATLAVLLAMHWYLALVYTRFVPFGPASLVGSAQGLRVIVEAIILLILCWTLMQGIRKMRLDGWMLMPVLLILAIDLAIRALHLGEALRPLRIAGFAFFFNDQESIIIAFAICALLVHRWVHSSRHQRELALEMKQAQEVQQVILPETRMELPGLIVESEYRPAQVVGGDFFQVIPLAGQGTLVVAGDVSGKGMRAAMMVSLIVGVIRTLAEQNPSPAAMLAGINRRLIGRTHGGFATCCAVLIRTDGMATFANAGHLQPYLNGEEIELPAGLPAGIVDGMSYEEVSLQIPPHAKLVLLSDGVVEARNEKGEIFGFDRTAAMANNSAAAIAHAAQAFGQDDDITVLTLTRLAST
jgi:hypothetical protein